MVLEVKYFINQDTVEYTVIDNSLKRVFFTFNLDGKMLSCRCVS